MPDPPAARPAPRAQQPSGRCRRPGDMCGWKTRPRRRPAGKLGPSGAREPPASATKQSLSIFQVDVDRSQPHEPHTMAVIWQIAGCSSYKVDERADDDHQRCPPRLAEQELVLPPPREPGRGAVVEGGYANCGEHEQRSVRRRSGLPVYASRATGYEIRLAAYAHPSPRRWKTQGRRRAARAARGRARPRAATPSPSRWPRCSQPE